MERSYCEAGRSRWPGIEADMVDCARNWGWGVERCGVEARSEKVGAERKVKVVLWPVPLVPAPPKCSATGADFQGINHFLTALGP